MDNGSIIKTPKDLESYVQYVYSSLLNLKNEGVVVSLNAILTGKSGARHEIDVFYQFEKSGIIHKVAFECKYLKRKVEKSDVVDFHGKVQDIGNIQGVFVSKSGYQSGAITYGNYYDITLLKIEDLPTLNILLAKRIKSVALPDESYVGEPFWTLMEEKEGALTGNYWSQKNRRFFGKKILPLFISKFDARAVLSQVPDKDEYVVRGIPQHTLQFLIEMVKMSKGKVLFSLQVNGEDENGLWAGSMVSAEELEARFITK